MPYFPSTYPNWNWWAAKVFLQEAERLFALHAPDAETGSHIRKTAVRNLRRAVRVLMELPPEPAAKDAGEIYLETAFPALFKMEIGMADVADLLKKVKEYQWTRFKEDRWDEFSGDGWYTYDASQIAEILGIDESEARAKLGHDSFTDDQQQKLSDYYDDETLDVMSQKYEEYCGMEEYELLRGFGGYGEFLGV